MARAYQRVADEIQRRIREGIYPSGLPLPSERLLESEFRVHRTTIRRALTALDAGGLITRSPGDRTYVRSKGQPSVAAFGLYAGDPDDIYARAIILQGMLQGIASRNASFAAVAAPAKHSVTSVDVDDEESESARDRQMEGQKGVVILPPRAVRVRRLREIRDQKPLVVIDRMIPGFETDFVGFNDFEAGYEAAKHLYATGHRRIGFLGHSRTETASLRDLGVQKFCQDSGVPFSPNFLALIKGLGTAEIVLKTLLDVSREDWPTALVCENDETAAFMYSCASRIGLRIPEDLALIGFGNAQVALLDALGVSTMAQPYETMGQEAVKLLLGRLGGDLTGGPLEIRLPMRLVPRSSCGAKTNGLEAQGIERSNSRPRRRSL